MWTEIGAARMCRSVYVCVCVCVCVWSLLSDDLGLMCPVLGMMGVDLDLSKALTKLSPLKGKYILPAKGDVRPDCLF